MSNPLDVTGKTSAEIVANIVSVYERATEQNKVDGANWYPEALLDATTMAYAHSVSIETAVAVIAHMSPRLFWSRNLLGANLVLGNKQVYPGFMMRSVNAAQNAMASADPIATVTGQKIKSFAANILGDTDAVTIDVWAMRVAFNGAEVDSWLKRKGFYDALAECYRIAAEQIGIEPSVLQAVTWIVKRNGRKD